jgi:hypothetical protein
VANALTQASLVELPTSVWLGALAAYSTFDPTFTPQNVAGNFFGAGIAVGADMYTFHQTRFKVGDELIDCVSVQKQKNYFTGSPESAVRVNLPFKSLAILAVRDIEVLVENA